MTKKDDPDWVEVASVGDDEEAVLIAGFLEYQGLPAVIEGPTTSPFPDDLGAFGMSRVMVPPDKADEARRLLASRVRESAREEEEETETGEE